MVVIGDSHVRRLMEFRYIIDHKLKWTNVQFIHRGGAQLNFVEENLYRAYGCDILIVMAGGNELEHASLGYYETVYERIVQNARENGIQAIVFPSLWPRAQSNYNRKALQVAERMDEKYWLHPYVISWMWDKRQPMRTIDGVHLHPSGYKKAMRYLIAL